MKRLIIVLAVLLLVVVGCTGGSSDAPKSEPKQITNVGDTLTINREIISAATSRDNFDEMMKFVLADDRTGFDMMHSRGQILLLEKGTKVKVLQLTFKGSYEVRVQDGPHKDKVVWLSRDFLEK